MKLKIFLVEDNSDTRGLLTLLLEGSGHEVHAAQTVREALRDFRRWRCDLLLSDIGLPDGSGCDLIEALRRDGDTPYGIAMSGFVTASDVAASLAAGFRHHLAKPIDIDELERIIEAAGDELEAARRPAASN